MPLGVPGTGEGGGPAGLARRTRRQPRARGPRSGRLYSARSPLPLWGRGRSPSARRARPVFGGVLAADPALPAKPAPDFLLGRVPLTEA